MRALVIAALLALPLAAAGAPLPFPAADMEAAGTEAWKAYGTPARLEKVGQAHAGQQALRVATDNKEVMGGGFEGVSRSLGELTQGDRVRVSFWMRPLAGKEVWIGIGRTSFDQIWRPFDTDWMQVVCDFRVRASGHHNIWITQQGTANDFLLDDFAVERIPRPALGTAPAGERVSLGGAAGRLSFCRRTGALCGISGPAAPESFLPLPDRQPLFALRVLGPDGRGIEEMGFDQAALESLREDAGRLTLVFALKPHPIRVTCRVARTAAGEFTFAGTVENRSDRTILEFAYPLLQGVRPALDSKALTLVHPYLCGQIVPNALRSEGCDSVYPGRAVMGWLDLSGEEGGLSLATHDPSRTGTRLTALPSVGDTFDLGLTKEVAIRPGQTWQAPEHVLLLHRGDWHAAADHYRAWARKWLGPPDVPAWVRNADGWVLMGVQNGVPFWRIPDVYRAAEWMGIDYLHVQGQGVDSMWLDAEGKRVGHPITFLYPSPMYGTPDDLKRAVRDIHDRAGHVMFYFLYERWTPSHSTAEHLGTAPRSAIPPAYPIPGLDFYAQNALLEHPGARPAAEHPYMTDRVMCLASPGWQEWMRHWAIDVYAKEFGADGFYWDVMGRNGPFRCFNARHDHAGENGWAAGSESVLRRVIQEGRKINPEYSCAIEGVQDALSPWVGFHLMSGGTKTPEVFRYTFPEVCLVDGFSNHTWRWSHTEKARRVFLAGERFDLHGYHAEVRKLVWLRKRLKPFIDWPARFMDTVGLSVSTPEVQARRFVRDDGRNRAVLVTLLNEAGRTDATVSVLLGAGFRVAGAHLFLPDGSTRPLAHAPAEAGHVRFAVPPETVSAALFVQSVEPALRVVPTLDQVRLPGRDGVEVTLFFPEGRPVPVNLSLRAPAGILLEEAPATPSESPAVLHRVWVPRGGLGALPGWEKILAEARWQSGSAGAWCLLCPPLANGNFERLRPDGHLEYWPSSPCVEEPAEGRHCLKLENPDGKAIGHVNLLTPIKPSTRYRFSARIRRDTAGTDARAAVVEYEDGAKLRVSANIGSGGKSGAWEQFETEFVSHPAPRSSAVYLYLGKSKSAWFDDLRLEEVR